MLQKIVIVALAVKNCGKFLMCNFFCMQQVSEEILNYILLVE